MKKNLSNMDRIVRLGLAVIFVVLWFQNIVAGTVGIVLLILAGVLVLTSIFSFCPLYKLLGISSFHQKKIV
jgi:hypothetical protein